VKQSTFTGRSWRHGLVILMHMVAGAVSRRLLGSNEPFLGGKRRRHSSPGAGRRTLRRVDSNGAYAHANAESSSTNSDDATSVASSEEPSNASGVAYSDAVTDDTCSGGEDAEDEAPVPTVSDREREYKEVFGEKPMYDAVLEVVCLAASLMGKLCGDNQEMGYSMTQSESQQLADEAYALVTKYVRVLFGPVNTTKMHTLAYHLLDELLLRGNVIEADISVNESLHKLIKIMWTNTKKQEASFTVRMLRCEQTMSHIIESDFADKATAAEAQGGSVSCENPADSGDAGLREVIVGDAASRADPDGVEDGGPDAAKETDEDAAMELDFRAEGDEAETDDLEEDSEEDFDVQEAMDDVVADSAAAEPSVRSDTEISIDGGGLARKRKRVRLSGRRVIVGNAAAADDGRLQQLPILLGAADVHQLVVVNTCKIEAMLPWRAQSVPQLVRAAAMLYRKPWFDDVYYVVPGGDAEPAAGPRSAARARRERCAPRGTGCPKDGVG